MKEWQILEDVPDSFVWPEETKPHCELLTKIANESAERGIDATRKFVANCTTRFILACTEEFVIPITVNDAQLENCYVCSPYSGAISYPLVELREIQNVALRAGLAGLIHSVSPILRMSKINRAVCINNWMLSTNLYPKWNRQNLRELRDGLIARFPKHAILMRSLNATSNESVIQQATDDGFLFAPSRQVYISDESEQQHLRHQNSHRDRKLVEQTDYEIVRHGDFTEADDERIKQLYDLLYLEKYTSLNPQFTTNLIKLWRETRTLNLTGLRNANGQLDGVIGCFKRNGVLTAPLVGYDTALSQEVGLYRMLMAIMFGESFDHGSVLNLSSGAAGFKRLRGARPSLEYTAVYCDHLPFAQRRAWRTLVWLLSHVGAPVLQKFEL